MAARVIDLAEWRCDREKRLRVTRLRPDFEVGVDGKSIVFRWRIVAAQQRCSARGPELARWPGMNARGIALALGIAATAVTAPADAEADRPVFVTVVGHGAIRFRLAIGRTAPFDSSENRMLFDAWLAPGRYEWSTSANLICFQHTSGALRESDWSVSRIVSPLISMGKAQPPRPAEIVVSMD